MTRTLTSYAASGCLVLLFACSSGSSDSGTNPTATSSSGSSSTGTGGAAGTNGGGAGQGGSSSGGAGARAGAAGVGVAGSTGSGGSAAGAGGNTGGAGARDGGGSSGTAGTSVVDAGRDAMVDAGAPGVDANRDASVDVGAPGTDAARDAGTDAGRDVSGDADASNFSFFVASLKALQTLSGKTEGFGGNLAFGQASGLEGADEICRQTAEMGMPGAGSKTWRAFLSATTGPGGTAVNARDRIGAGPWYDRNGRLLAANLTDLLAGARPVGDAMLVNDFSNERGEPNHYVGPGGYVPGTTFDDHDTLTGSDTMGVLKATSMADTCNDWTSSTVTGRPWAGHSWPRSSTNGQQWASDHQVPGCIAGIDVTLGGSGSGSCVGCAGGYGGIFCFAVP
jgi:hypothetical protein